MTHKLIKTDNYLLVVDDSEIKEADYFYFKHGIVTKIYKADSVEQKVSIENFEHDRVFNYKECKCIVVHLPLNGSPILEGVDLLPPYSRHQEDGLEQLVNTMFRNKIDSLEEIHSDYILGVTEGYNKAREKYKYTEEDMLEFANWCRIHDKKHPNEVWMIGQLLTKYESLYQYPTEFDTEDVLTPSQIFYPNDVPYSSPKTITTAQGVQWVGKYK